MKTSVPARSFPPWLTRLVVASVIAAVVVLFGVWPPMADDLLMHLTVGRYTWEHGWPPLVDVFTYTTPGEPFIAHSWLAELVFHLVMTGVGTVGFMVLRCTLITVALSFALSTARMLKAPWSSTMFVAPLVLAVIWARMEIRPQLFTTAFLAVELWLLMSVHTGQRSWRWLWVLPPLYALWINLHGGWPQGIAMLMVVIGAVLLSHYRRRVLGRGQISLLPLRPLVMVLVACLLALFINPYGLRLIYFPVEMQASWIRAIGPEWQSPWLDAGWRVVPGAGRAFPIRLVFFVYVALLAGVLLRGAKRWRGVDVVPAAVMVLWAVLSMRHLRTVADTLLLTGPCVAASMPTAWQVRRWPMWVGLGGLVILIGMGIAVEARVRTWRPMTDRPHCLEAMIVRLGQPVRIFGSAWDRWLQYDLPHLVKVSFVWEYVAGPVRVAEFDAVWTSQQTMAAFLDRYQVNLILRPNSAFRNAQLFESMGWAVIYQDDAFFMMARTPTSTPVYRHIHIVQHAPVTLSNASQVLEEAERALQQCPEDATFAWTYKADALRRLGRDQEGLEAERQIPARMIIR